MAERLNVGLESGVVARAGAWLSFEDLRLGGGGKKLLAQTVQGDQGAQPGVFPLQAVALQGLLHHSGKVCGVERQLHQPGKPGLQGALQQLRAGGGGQQHAGQARLRACKLDVCLASVKGGLSTIRIKATA